MKRLTLDQTWEQCLAMWKWISRRCEDTYYPKSGHVDALKAEWLEKNGYEKHSIIQDCFMCHQASPKGYYDCDICQIELC